MHSYGIRVRVTEQRDRDKNDKPRETWEKDMWKAGWWSPTEITSQTAAKETRDKSKAVGTALDQ